MSPNSGPDATSTGVPDPETATERRERLEAAGVVEGYRPVVDDAALGYEVTAVFRLAVTGTDVGAVVADLRDTGRMVAIYEVTGADDVVAVGKFTDTGDLDATVKTLLTHEGVRGVGTDVVLDVVTENDPLPVDVE